MYDSYFSYCIENDYLKGFGHFMPLFICRRKGRRLANNRETVIKEAHDMYERYLIAVEKEINVYLEYLVKDLEWYQEIAPELDQKLKKQIELRKELKEDMPLSKIIPMRDELSDVSLRITKINEISRSVYLGITNDIDRLKTRLRKSQEYHLKRLSAFVDAAISEKSLSENDLRPYLFQINTNEKVEKEVVKDIILNDPYYSQVVLQLDRYLGATEV